MAGNLNLNSGCRGNAGLDGRIQILFSRHEYSSPQGRLSYNNRPLTHRKPTQNTHKDIIIQFTFEIWAKISPLQ